MNPVKEHFKALSEHYGDDWPGEALKLLMRMNQQGVTRNVPMYLFLCHWVEDTLRAGYQKRVSDNAVGF